MERYTDAQIMEGILHSDRKVLDFIYLRFYGKVERFLIGRGGDPEHIRDVFQEALMVIFQKVSDKGLVLSCTFSTYLFAVCKNIWMHDMRKKKYHLVEDALLDVALESEDTDREMEEKLTTLYEHHFQQLSQDCRELLRMHFNGASLADIMKKFGYSSEHYTSDRKYRCKQSLYNRIRKDPKYKEIIHGS